VSILTDEHLCALGRVTVNVAGLEQYLRDVIADMIAVERQVGLIVTSKFSFYESLQTFESLCRREIKRRGNDPELSQRLEQITDRANRLRDDRNDVIHAAWRADRNGVARILRPDAEARDGRPRPSSEIVSAAAIEALAERAIAVQLEIDHLVRDELRLLTTQRPEADSNRPRRPR
jgi:hypothetical protein